MRFWSKPRKSDAEQTVSWRKVRETPEQMSYRGLKLLEKIMDREETTLAVAAHSSFLLTTFNVAMKVHIRGWRKTARGVRLNVADDGQTNAGRRRRSGRAQEMVQHRRDEDRTPSRSVTTRNIGNGDLLGEIGSDCP
eukprot:scaffold7967_cov382-Pinguiococcus_pyrenoidosus.AAC.1